MRIFWAEETKDDFRRFDEFLSPINPDAARRAAQTIREKTKVLAIYPEIGTSLDDGTGRREFYIQFGKGGYVLSYTPDYDADMVRILRIWHSREDREA